MIIRCAEDVLIMNITVMNSSLWWGSFQDTRIFGCEWIGSWVTHILISDSTIYVIRVYPVHSFHFGDPVHAGKDKESSGHEHNLYEWPSPKLWSQALNPASTLLYSWTLLLGRPAIWTMDATNLCHRIIRDFQNNIVSYYGVPLHSVSHHFAHLQHEHAVPHVIPQLICTHLGTPPALSSMLFREQSLFPTQPLDNHIIFKPCRHILRISQKYTARYLTASLSTILRTLTNINSERIRNIAIST